MRRMCCLRVAESMLSVCSSLRLVRWVLVTFFAIFPQNRIAKGTISSTQGYIHLTPAVQPVNQKRAMAPAFFRYFRSRVTSSFSSGRWLSHILAGIPYKLQPLSGSAPCSSSHLAVSYRFQWRAQCSGVPSRPQHSSGIGGPLSIPWMSRASFPTRYSSMGILLSLLLPAAWWSGAEFDSTAPWASKRAKISGLQCAAASLSVWPQLDMGRMFIAGAVILFDGPRLGFAPSFKSNRMLGSSLRLTTNLILIS